MGNFPLFKFQQVMGNIKKFGAQIKHFGEPEVVSLRATSLQSLSLKQVSLQPKWQEMKQERLAGTRLEGTVCCAEEPRLYTEQ